MITYKYKLYRTDKTKHLDRMLREACFVWNHALALQKRYYRLFKKYIPLGVIVRPQSELLRGCHVCIQESQVFMRESMSKRKQENRFTLINNCARKMDTCITDRKGGARLWKA